MALCFVSFALLLLAVAAGMFLLARTNKDALGNFYRFVSWFIIVSGFLGIGLCAVMCLFRLCCWHHGMNNRMMWRNNMPGFEQEMTDGGGERRIIIKKFSGDEECPMMKGHCEKGGNCCREDDDDKEVRIKKDTVIIKTK